jgi:hypothetical protein
VAQRAATEGEKEQTGLEGAASDDKPSHKRLLKWKFNIQIKN